MSKIVRRLTVENFQPVPLRPLREVLKDHNGVLYVHTFIHKGEKDDEKHHKPLGWVTSGGNDEWIELEDSVTCLGYNNPASYVFLLECYDVDLDRTMARTLQPGERLVVTIGYED